VTNDRSDPEELVASISERSIQALVAAEFGAIAEEFLWHTLSIDEARRSTDSEITRPGVYVFLRDGQPIKIGRHLQNSRKRALEHIRDDTGGQMASLEAGPNATLILINARDPSKLHWICALEVFLEGELKPAVRSKRTGW
jgi:hypothetical protein